MSLSHLATLVRKQHERVRELQRKYDTTYAQLIEQRATLNEAKEGLEQMQLAHKAAVDSTEARRETESKMGGTS